MLGNEGIYSLSSVQIPLKISHLASDLAPLRHVSGSSQLGWGGYLTASQRIIIGEIARNERIWYGIFISFEHSLVLFRGASGSSNDFSEAKSTLFGGS